MAVNPFVDLVSPCIGVCVLDADTGWCRGCLRTREEIAGWCREPHEGKLAILERLRDRREEGGLPARRPTRRRRRRTTG